MKIAFVSFDFGEYSIRLASALAHHVRIQFLMREDIAKPFVDLLDPRVEFQPFIHPRLRQPFQQFKMIRHIVQRIKEFEPDLIHFQHRHQWFNFALPFLTHYPLVITIHDPIHHVGDRSARKTPQFIADFGYRRADQVIVHGEAVKDLVNQRLRIPKELIHVVPHIALGNDKNQNHIQEEDQLILFFGRIWEYKGLEYLIQAEPMITEKVPEAQFMIAGRGEDFERYRRMMIHPDRFIVHNEFISDQRCAELYRRASIVVLPYIEASQSGVIPMAYTYSKPVVATSVGGLPEMIEHGQTGYLVPPRDARALAEAVINLLKNKELRHRFGKNAKQKSDDEWSPDVVARQTVEVYKQILKK